MTWCSCTSIRKGKWRRLDERKQFTFYRSFWEAVKGLPKKDRLPILEAIISYALDGVVPSGLSQSQSAFFLLVKPNLDSARKKASNGKQGGSKPKAKGKQTPSEKENEEEIEKENEIEHEIEKKQTAPAPGNAFTAFWDAYPNKLGREAAWDAWKQLNPSAAMAIWIMNGLTAWKKAAQWLEDGGRFVPRASKWLLEKHFEYPPSPAQNGIPKGASGELGEAELEAIQRLLREDAP